MPAPQNAAREAPPKRGWHWRASPLKTHAPRFGAFSRKCLRNFGRGNLSGAATPARGASLRPSTKARHQVRLCIRAAPSRRRPADPTIAHGLRLQSCDRSRAERDRHIRPRLRRRKRRALSRCRRRPASTHRSIGQYALALLEWPRHDRGLPTRLERRRRCLQSRPHGRRRTKRRFKTIAASL